jgi:hypothetical protein
MTRQDSQELEPERPAGDTICDSSRALCFSGAEPISLTKKEIHLLCTPHHPLFFL